MRARPPLTQLMTPPNPPRGSIQRAVVNNHGGFEAEFVSVVVDCRLYQISSQ